MADEQEACDSRHVMAEDEGWDDELKALVAIVETFDKLDMPARRRVMRWVVSRYWPEVKLESR